MMPDTYSGDERVMNLTDLVFYTVKTVPANKWAEETLKQARIGIAVTPGPEVTHLLLPVPSFQSGGMLRGDGDLKELLSMLPKDITILGGNLNARVLEGYRRIDLLQDEEYLAKNAAITAHCAVKLALQSMDITWEGCPVLVIGWGRIGKCLAYLLKSNGASVTVAARKPTDRAMLRALGFRACVPAEDCGEFRVAFNTAPADIVSEAQAQKWGEGCLKIDLASVPGIAGADVIWGRGLPGVLAPESSGALIAQTALRLLKGGCGA